MSNGLAIATVTQALALLVANNLRPEIDIAVSVETRKPPAEPPPEPTVTIFLYQVTPNASMRHHDLPTRASDGTLLKRPAAPLDLHYLISAYGDEIELVGQRLIGSVVRTLHEIPVLPKELIAEAAEKPYLAGSDLAEAIQRVRFTPTQMDIDETSKLWGMLHQTPYALSVCYQGALVFVEGREQPVPPKPVRERTVRVAPFGAPGAPERPELPTGAEAGSPAAGGASAPAPLNGRGTARNTGAASRGGADGASATDTGGTGTAAGGAAGPATTAGAAAGLGTGSAADAAGSAAGPGAAAAAPSPAKKRATAAKAATGTTEPSTPASRTRKATGAARGGTRRSGTTSGKKRASGRDDGTGAGGRTGGSGGTGSSGAPDASGKSGDKGDKEA
ncbi:DUF4255 domain-containing protein [Streptomyces sp. NPDC048845]|uniref:DUF4255 domain-containing protein n=1 Tax=Streptomyces sp. NPDC048845 TaxID=3155390 RepID=UPI003418846B